MALPRALRMLDGINTIILFFLAPIVLILSYVLHYRWSVRIPAIFMMTETVIIFSVNIEDIIAFSFWVGAVQIIVGVWALRDNCLYGSCRD